MKDSIRMDVERSTSDHSEKRATLEDWLSFDSKFSLYRSHAKIGVLVGQDMLILHLHAY